MNTVLQARPRNFVSTPTLERTAFRALRYLKSGYSVHLKGPAGTGKTTLALHLADLLGRPIMLLFGDDEFKTSDLIGNQTGYTRKKVVDNYIHSVMKVEDELRHNWIDSRLTLACREGFTLVYDEFNRSRPEVNNVLLSALEEKLLVLPPNQNRSEYIRVSPHFRAIFTSNPEEYCGVHGTQDALQDRLITINMPEPDELAQQQILTQKVGIDAAAALQIVRIVKAYQTDAAPDMISSLRPSLMIATICNDHGITPLAENADFRDVCSDVLLDRSKHPLPEATRHLWDLFNQFVASQVDIAEQLKGTRDGQRTARLHGDDDESGAAPEMPPIPDPAPVAEEPVMEQPVAEEAVAEEPAIEEPIAEEPVLEESALEEPVAEELVIEEEPALEEPVAEEPVAEELLVEEPVAEESVIEESVAEELVAEEPVAEEPVLEEPVAEADPFPVEAHFEEPMPEDVILEEEPFLEEATQELPAFEEEPFLDEVADEAQALDAEPFWEEPSRDISVYESAVFEEPGLDEPSPEDSAVLEESGLGEATPVLDQYVVEQPAPSEQAAEAPGFAAAAAESMAVESLITDSALDQAVPATTVIAAVDTLPVASSSPSAQTENVIESRIFDFLDTVGSASFSRIETDLGLTRFQVVNALKSMLDQGLIEKGADGQRPSVYQIRAEYQELL
ncbi:MAG: gas vesicle protein GvpN [Spirulina sp.]